MQFHDYQTQLEKIGHRKGFDKLGKLLSARMMQESPKGAIQEAVKSQCYSEYVWEDLRRPYYNVYPTVVPMFLKLKLSFPLTHVKLPTGALAIRLPVNRNPFPVVESMLVSHRPNGDLLFHVHLGDGERNTLHISLIWYDEETIDEQLNTQPLFVKPEVRHIITPEQLKDAVRLACALCLLDSEDYNIINPDVLRKDEHKLREALSDEEALKLLEGRAFRRRGPGWEIGKFYEQERGPFVVPPHPQLYWTGPGRKIPKIITRRGYVCNRSKLEEVPHGYDESRSSRESEERTD